MIFQAAIKKMEMVLIPALGSIASLWGHVLLERKLGTSSVFLNFPLFLHSVLRRSTAACKALLLPCCNQQGGLKLEKSSHRWLPIVPCPLCFVLGFCKCLLTKYTKHFNKEQPGHPFLKAFIPTFAVEASQLSKGCSSYCL